MRSAPTFLQAKCCRREALFRCDSCSMRLCSKHVRGGDKFGDHFCARCSVNRAVKAHRKAVRA